MDKGTQPKGLLKGFEQPFVTKVSFRVCAMCNGWLKGLPKRLLKGLLRVCSSVGLRGQRADANGWLNGLAQRFGSKVWLKNSSNGLRISLG